MKKIAVLLLLCTCFVLYSADDFKNALPADGVGYVYVDVKTYMKEINTFNGLVDAFSAEEPLGEFLKPLVEKLDEKLKEVETENDIDFSIKESVTFLKTEMCLYVAGPSYMKETGIPALLFAMKAGENSEDISHILDVVSEKIVEEDETVTAETLDIGDAEFKKLTFTPSKPEEEDDKKMFEGMDEEWIKELKKDREEAYRKEVETMKNNPAIFGVAGGMLVISNSSKLISSFLENIDDKDSESLGNTAEFRKSMAAIGGGNSPLTVYASLTNLVALVLKMPEEDPEDQEEKEETLVKMMKWGFSDVSSVGISTLFEGEQLHQKVFISFPEEQYGILRAVLNGSGMPEIPRNLDPKTFLVSGFKFNVPEVYAEVIKMLTAVNPQFPEQFEQSKAQMKMQGIDIEKIITSLGGTLVLYQVPNTNIKKDDEDKKDINEFIQKGKTEFSVIALQLANSEPITALLGLLDAPQFAQMIPKNEFMGEKVYSVQVAAQALNSVPGFTVYNNFLIFSDSVEEVQNTIRRGESEEFTLAKNLADAFDRVKGMKPDGGLAGFSMPGGRNNVIAKAYEEEFRRVIAEGLEKINKELEINLTVENLPSYDKIKKYINMNQYVRGGMVEGGYLILSTSENAEKVKAE